MQFRENLRYLPVVPHWLTCEAHFGLILITFSTPFCAPAYRGALVHVCVFESPVGQGVPKNLKDSLFYIFKWQVLEVKPKLEA